MGRLDYRDASEPRTPDVDCRSNPPECSEDERGVQHPRGTGSATSTWAPAEEAAFFEALRNVAGSPLDVVLATVVVRLPRRALKQVHTMYGRVRRRLFGALAPRYAESDFSQLETHRLMEACWRAARSCGSYLSSGLAAQPVTRSQRLQRQFAAALLQEAGALVRARGSAAAPNADAAGQPVTGTAARRRALPPAEELRPPGRFLAAGSAAMRLVDLHPNPSSSSTRSAVFLVTPVSGAVRGGGAACMNPHPDPTSAGPKPAPRLTVQFLPADAATAARVAAAGGNPHLELDCKARKTARTVTEFLAARWGGGALRLLAPAAYKAQAGVTWGGAGCDADLTMAAVFAALGAPEPFQLLPLKRRAPGSPLAAGADPGAGAAGDEADQVDLRCLEDALGSDPGSLLGGDLGALLGGGGESWLGMGLDACDAGGCLGGRAFQELFP
ncbi:hypothetical protein WJX81_003237 [Elliptochloris bilobata]|uniref:Myb-like domain-containing protein n=1 Tax=Elliptochloris bilobata TaxID=381761 RepID=A0AAW1RR50_9CHLO